jgi:hypothetical protein
MTRQAAAIPGRSRRGAVTGKLKTALDLMVWDNLKRKDAAAKAGLADSSLRFAFRKSHVMAYYHAELKALRDNLRAHNVHRLDKIADESKNDMARVDAMRYCLKQYSGGAGGIRTLDRALQPYNGLANRRLQPLGHSSMVADMPDTGASRKLQIVGRRIPCGLGGAPHRTLSYEP